LPFDCTMETQNFRPPDERELTFSAYTKKGTAADVCGVDLATKKVTIYTETPDEYDEPEGIYPDGRHTLVECDRQNHQGTGHIDLWRLALDGSGDYVRLTHFSDFPDYKASNPVVSDDGRYFAFQMGHAGEAAGVGHGIFIYDIAKVATGDH
jgi:Tol biopolymer transport system component